MAAPERNTSLQSLKGRLGAVVALFIIALLGVACDVVGAAPQVNVTPTPAPESTLTVGVTLPSLADPLYISMLAGVVESAERLEVELVIRQADNDARTQLQQIDQLLEMAVDAIILNPVDSAAIGAGVQQANRAGVPVITVERRVRGASVTSHIAANDVAGGEMAAGFLVERLEEEGRVVEIMGTPGTSVAQDRSSGFGRVLGAYDGMEIAARGVAYFDRERARLVFAEILEEHDDIDAVFAHNDVMILGAIEAAEQVGRAGDIVFVGYDAIDDAVRAIEAGRLTATVAQQAEEMGHLSMEMAVEQLRGGDVSEQLTVDLAIITR